MSIEVHTGATRTVICIGKVAIKIPRMCSWYSFLRGLQANMQERLFNCIAPQLHAQVLYADRCGFVVVMERADRMASTELYPYIGNSTIEELFDACIKLGLPIERKYCDVGYFNGVWKIVDFGG